MNKLIPIIVGFVIVAGGAFYAGMQYDKNKTSAVSTQQNSARTGMFGQRGGIRGDGMEGGPSGGEIIAKDDMSVTIKLRDGGSKIIFYSGTTTVTKSDTGTAKDLAVGQQIIANGTTNTDGSVTAQSIQIRPAQAPRAVPAMIPGAK